MINSIVGFYSGTIAYTDGSVASWNCNIESKGSIDRVWSVDQDYSRAHTGNIAHANSAAWYESWAATILELPFMSALVWDSTPSTLKSIRSVIHHLSMTITKDDNTQYPFSITHEKGEIINHLGNSMDTIPEDIQGTIDKIGAMLGMASDAEALEINTPGCCPVPPGWDISAFTDTGDSLDLNWGEPDFYALTFSPDGGMLYFHGDEGEYSFNIFSYSLPIPWDITSVDEDARLNYQSLPDWPSYNRVYGMWTGPDGTHMYVGCRYPNNDVIIDLVSSTAPVFSHAATSINGSIPTTGASLIAQSGNLVPTINNDGTKLLICGNSPNSIKSATLDTPWDIESIDESTLTTLSFPSSIGGMYVKSDGLQIFVLADGDNEIWQYDLSTAFDISTAVKNPAGTLTIPSDINDIFLSPDGSKLFLCGDSILLYA